MLRVVIALIAFLFAIPVEASELWRGATAGETIDQILARFPEARRNSAPSTLGSGAKCEVHIPSIEVVRRPFEACFYFEDGRLAQVTLSLSQEIKGHSGNLAFDEVLEALRSRYGSESNLQRKGGLLTQHSADWYRPPVNISLIMIYVGRDGEVVLNINYQTRVAKDSANL